MVSKILPSVPTTIPTIRVTNLRTTIIGHISLLIHLLRSASLQRFSSIRFCMCKSRLLLHHIDYRVALYTIPIVIFGDVLNRPIRYVKSTFNHWVCPTNLKRHLRHRVKTLTIKFLIVSLSNIALQSWRPSLCPSLLLQRYGDIFANFLIV